MILLHKNMKDNQDASLRDARFDNHEPGDTVIYDKDYSTECRVTVVKQTSLGLFTKIRYPDGQERSVLTYRLTKP